MPIIWSFSFIKYVSVLTALPSYIFYIPTYINILQVFAFCRIDDLSWGTKGLDKSGEPILDPDQRKLAREWERRKFIFVLQYVASNVVLCYLVIKFGSFPLMRNYIILISMCLVAFLLLFRLIPAFIYLLSYKGKKICRHKLNQRVVRDNLANGKKVLEVLQEIELKAKEL